MKNLYQNPEMEIVEFESEDIICTSSGFEVNPDTDWSYGGLN